MQVGDDKWIINYEWPNVDMKLKAFTFFLVQNSNIIYSFLFFYYTSGSLFHFWFLVLLVSVTFLWILMPQVIPSNSFYHVTKNHVHNFSNLSNIYIKDYHFWSMYLGSTSITKLLWKKWLYLLNAWFVFDRTFKNEKSNLLT